MTKKEFLKWSENRILYLDGATGSNLLKRGMPGGICPEKWILEHPDVLIGLQKEYVEAGSNILYTPTFSGNRVKLEEYGLKQQLSQINCDLVRLTRQAAGGRALAAGDITMTGRQLSPMGQMDFEELVEIYKEQITFLAEAGVDLLVVETMMSLQETRAAVIAAKEVCDLAIMATVTFEGDGRTLYGTDAVTAAVTLESLGVCAVGANCSTGPDQMAEIVAQMADAVSIPIIAKPNAGMPALNQEGETVYQMGPEDFAEQMQLLINRGASVLGGCCGTTPDHIRQLVEKSKGKKPLERKKRVCRYLTSERKTLAFSLEDPFLIVGERINPTGKKKLQEELRNGSMELVRQFAEEQEENGARVLDVNMGMSGIDEKEMMLRAVEEVTQATSLPLALDSSHIEVLEAALRRYPGRALVNSVSGERMKLEKLLPVVKKYGAMFILLPLSDAGLPQNLEEKKEIIQAIVQCAQKLDMNKEDIVVDGLVATVGASPAAALETLETIRYCKEQGYATICGLSNISFGLPERSNVNTAFLTMAIQQGLTMAIANPGQQLLVNASLAADLLLNKTGADIHYIERMARQGEAKEHRSAVQEKERTLTASEEVREAVLKGKKGSILEWTKQALSENLSPQELLNTCLLPAINEVGELFDRGKYFLPQLIASAEAMKLSVEYLEPFLMENSEKEKMPVIVIATVEGDIHDIGKNLVALMLKNYGFTVIDLGKDVSKERIIEAAKQHHAKIIALSALMTTTMQEMKKVIAFKKQEGVEAFVMIGGAVITQDYADEIGADGYSSDAAEAVRVAKRLLQID